VTDPAGGPDRVGGARVVGDRGWIEHDEIGVGARLETPLRPHRRRDVVQDAGGQVRAAPEGLGPVPQGVLADHQPQAAGEGPGGAGVGGGTRRQRPLTGVGAMIRPLHRHRVAGDDRVREGERAAQQRAVGLVALVEELEQAGRGRIERADLAQAVGDKDNGCALRVHLGDDVAQPIDVASGKR